MSKVAVLAMKYYLNNEQLDFTQVNNLKKDNLQICDLEILKDKLKDINTRLIDRQSLALEAALKSFDENECYKNINKSEISVIVGSLSAAVYPIFEYLVSGAENGVNFVNPTFFPNTVANAPASRLSIWNQFRNRLTTLSQGKSSGLDAVIMAKDEIDNNLSRYVWAGASEEMGAALMFVGTEDSSEIKPLAYIKNYESRYIGNISESQRKDFINNTLLSWKSDNIKLEVINSQDSKIFSLEPMIDIGKALLKIVNKELDSVVIISLDEMGFLSMLELGR